MRYGSKFAAINEIPRTLPLEAEQSCLGSVLQLGLSAHCGRVVTDHTLLAHSSFLTLNE